MEHTYSQALFLQICGVYNFYQRHTNLSINGINIGCFDDLDLETFEDAPMADSVSLSLVHR